MDNVIDGFKVRVSSDEMYELLEEIVLREDEKVAAYERALTELRAAGEQQKDQSFDTISSLKSRIQEHQDKADAARFVRDHLIAGDYLLGRYELDAIGIARY